MSIINNKAAIALIGETWLALIKDSLITLLQSCEFPNNYNEF